MISCELKRQGTGIYCISGREDAGNSAESKVQVCATHDGGRRTTLPERALAAVVVVDGRLKVSLPRVE